MSALSPTCLCPSSLSKLLSPLASVFVFSVRAGVEPLTQCLDSVLPPRHAFLLALEDHGHFIACLAQTQSPWSVYYYDLSVDIDP